jgi:valyl-tRNA synthetase
MMVMGIHFMKEVPFKTVFLHGLVRTADGKKMSKSSGTAIDPLEIIKEYGTDALRFTLTSLVTSGGQDIKLSVDKIKGSRNFMNKLWNVTRFVLMQEQNNGDGTHHEWILSRYHSTLQEVTKLYNEMRFGEAANLIYEFTWNEFCDWYIEMSKQGGNTEILKNVLNGILQMLHPIAPFITEELWHLLGHKDMIMVSSFPKADESKIKPQIEKEFKLVIDLVNSIRSVRSEMNVPLGKEIDVVLLKTDAVSQKILKANESFITKIAKLKSLQIKNEKPEPAVLKVVEGIEVYLPMAGLIDIAEERVRLSKEIENLKKEVTRFEGKLSNAAFVDKAPPAVIDGERAKQKTAQEKLNTIQKQLDSLSDSLAARA